MLYSLDLRIKVIKAVNAGIPKKDIIKTFNICKQTIYNWLELSKKYGSVDSIKKPRISNNRGIKDDVEFEKYVNKHADFTQKEMALDFNVGASTIGRTLKRIKYSRKKRLKLIKKEPKKNVLFIMNK